MSRWGRDITIAVAALMGGYFLFSPKTQSPASAPQPQLAMAAFGQNDTVVEATPATPLLRAKTEAVRPPDPTKPSDNDRAKQTVGTAVTIAAIAAILVEESRNAYYASGRPCACPDDRNRAGRRCGGNSAYSRPGGAQPYCSPSDVPLAVIEKYRQRLSLR